MKTPLFWHLCPCFTPSYRSQAPPPVLPGLQGTPRTRCARPKPQPPRSARPPRCAPSAAVPTTQGRPSRVAASRPATPAAPPAAAGDSGVPHGGTPYLSGRVMRPGVAAGPAIAVPTWRRWRPVLAPLTLRSRRRHPWPDKGRRPENIGFE